MDCAPATPRPVTLEPLPFQRDLADCLQRQEPGLWKWFAAPAGRAAQTSAVQLDLLKSTYRIEPETQPRLYAAADDIRRAYGLDAPLTCYQAQTGGGLNAALAYVPDHIHLIFSGPVLTTLTDLELRAVLAHELAHFVLYHGWNGQFLIANDLLRALCQDPQAAPVHHETLRLFMLYTEVFADRGAGLVTGDVTAAIATLIKMETGLTEVSAASYLRQADEIFSAGQVQASQLTHPEPYIRARALKLWTERGPDAAADIEQMIEGPWSLERLGLVRQRRLAELTRTLLQRFLAPAWLRSESVLAHARLFFDDFDQAAPNGAAVTTSVLEQCDASLRDYVCYLLLDFVTVDRDLTEPALAAALVFTKELGLASRLGELAIKELGLAKKQFAKLERDAAAIVAQANQTGLDA